MTQMLHFARKLKSDKLMSDYIEALTGEVGASAGMAIGHGGEKLTAQSTVCMHNPMSLSQQFQAHMAANRGAAVVVVPHGEMSPYMLSHEHWLRKRLLRLPGARLLLSKADAVVALTSEEATRLGHLSPKARVVTIPTQIYTSAQTTENECLTWTLLARKIDDTRAPLLTSWNEIKALATLVTAALTQPDDTPHTFPEAQLQLLANSNAESWRRLLLCAESEGVLEPVLLGAQRLGVAVPESNTAEIERFVLRHPKYTDTLPNDRTLHPHHRLSWRLKSVCHETSPELKKLCTLIVNAKMLKNERRLSLGSVMNVYDAVRHTDYDEDELADLLSRLRLKRFARRLLGLIVELTGLEEGYQPLKPKSPKPQWLKPRN